MEDLLASKRAASYKNVMSNRENIDYPHSKEVRSVYLQVDFVNLEEGKTYKTTGITPALQNDINSLFQFLQRNFGSCTGRMYGAQKRPTAIGWVFRKKVVGVSGAFTREAWITLYNSLDENDVHIL